jgi:hypothetical protein
LGPADFVRGVIGSEERRATDLGSNEVNAVERAAVLVLAVRTEVDGEWDSL